MWRVRWQRADSLYGCEQRRVPRAVVRPILPTKSRSKGEDFVKALAKPFIVKNGSLSCIFWRCRYGAVLQFESGVATYRRFDVLTPQQDGGTGVLTLQWEERGTEVGAHPVAAPPATVDALYDQCAREVLPQDPDRNDVSLYFDAAGILLACFYVPRNCADDCSFGVGIGNLQMGKTY